MNGVKKGNAKRETNIDSGGRYSTKVKFECTRVYPLRGHSMQYVYLHGRQKEYSKAIAQWEH